MAEESNKPADSRVDPPHAIHRAAHKPELVAQAAGEIGNAPPALDLESTPAIEKHAASLSERLQEQHQALERRAAELQSREGDLEAKVESARLWFEEQSLEIEQQRAELGVGDNAPTMGPDPEVLNALEEQKSALESRERELDSRQADLYEQIEELTAQRGRHAERVAELDKRQQHSERVAEEMLERESQAARDHAAKGKQAADLDRQRAELEAQQQELENRAAGFAEREAQLAARQAEIQLALKRYEGLGINERRMATAQREANEAAARTLHLDEAEAMLAEENQSHQRDRQQLQIDRQAWRQEQLIERRKIEEERSLAKQEQAHKETLLRERSERVDEREAAIQRLQVELQASQREVLEMRLATEETWAQLTGALAPASLSRSIAQVRTRLADHYGQMLAQLEDRRAELDTVADQLAEEQERLEDHGRQLQGWAQRRDEEFEQQAARLIARERELDRQQRQYEQMEARWSHERGELRGRIQELLAAMRHEPARVVKKAA